MAAPSTDQVRVTFEAHGIEVSLSVAASFETVAAVFGDSVSEIAASGIDLSHVEAALRDQVVQALPQLREAHESVRLGLMVAYNGLLKEQADSTPAPKGRRK